LIEALSDGISEAVTGLYALARRRRVNGERVHAARQLARQGAVDQAVAFQPGLSFEGVRHDIDTEVSLPARPMPGMAFVLVGFVHNLEALRRESLGQLLCDLVAGLHAVRLKDRQTVGQWLLRCGFR
jgi:hypothetical protein